MQGFVEWLKEHPAIALGVGAVAVFLVMRSIAQKNQQSGSSGSGAQGDIGSGQVVSAGGYTFVPTGSSDQSSSTTSGDVNPNTASELDALSGFLQSFQAAPGGVTPPTPAPTPAPTTVTQTQTQTVKITKPKGTKHTHGTPPQVPGVPIVAKHPHNPSPLPPVRQPPVTHPVQGKNHPIVGPITPIPFQPPLNPRPVDPIPGRKPPTMNPLGG